ncbi:FAD/NAD(P)-binding protein [Candidatus Woesearchaeota archaeon]|nr:FAD/NAD(P)-binding protein [Candidatus Woesearchaeota archaeon]
MKSELIPKKTRILSNFRETSDIFTLILQISGSYMPGQFVQIGIPGIGECPISVASYSKNHLKISIREVGKVTRALGKLRKNSFVYIRGPYGRGYPLVEFQGKCLILIGAGCGVATLKSIIEYIEYHREKYKDILLFFGYRNINDIIYKKEVNKWKNTFNIKIALSKENAKTCLDWDSGHITDVIAELKLRTENTGVFICGPPKMINDTVEILKKKGFNDEQIYVSTERLMYCSIGMCCHCMIRGKFTCTDGPVFRFDEIGYYKND